MTKGPKETPNTGGKPNAEPASLQAPSAHDFEPFLSALQKLRAETTPAEQATAAFRTQVDSIVAQKFPQPPSLLSQREQAKSKPDTATTEVPESISRRPLPPPVNADEAMLRRAQANIASASAALHQLRANVGTHAPHFSSRIDDIFAARDIEPDSEVAQTILHKVGITKGHDLWSINTIRSEHPTALAMEPGLSGEVRSDYPHADSLFQQFLERLYNARNLLHQHREVRRETTWKKPRPEQEGLITAAFTKGRTPYEIAFTVEEIGSLLLHILWEIVKLTARTTKNILAYCLSLIPTILAFFVGILSGKNNAIHKSIMALVPEPLENPTTSMRTLGRGLLLTNNFTPIATEARNTGFPDFNDLTAELMIATQNLPFTTNRNKVFWELVPVAFSKSMHPDNAHQNNKDIEPEDIVRNKEIAIRRRRLDYAIYRLKGDDVRAFFNALRDVTRTEKLEADEIETELVKVLNRASVRTKRNRDALRTLREELPDLAKELATRNFQVLHAQRLLGIYPKIAKVKAPQQVGQASPDRWLFDIDDKEYEGKNLDLPEFIRRMKLIDYRHSSVHAAAEKLIEAKNLTEGAATKVRVALVDGDIASLQAADGVAGGGIHFRDSAPGNFVELAAEYKAERKI